MSSSTRPRVVSAGVPMRSPDGFIGGRSSKGIALRLTVIPTSSRRSSAVLPSRPVGREVDENQMDVGAAGEHVDPARDQLVGEGLRVGDRLALALPGTGRSAAIPRATALAAMMCISGPPCWPGKTARLIVGRELLLAEDHPAARPAERLVDRGGDHVGVRDGARVLAGGDEPGEVRHVDHQLGADRVGDLAEGGEVELPRIGATSRRRSPSACAPRRAGRPRPCRRGWSSRRRRTATTS